MTHLHPQRPRRGDSRAATPDDERVHFHAGDLGRHPVREQRCTSPAIEIAQDCRGVSSSASSREPIGAAAARSLRHPLGSCTARHDVLDRVGRRGELSRPWGGLHREYDREHRAPRVRHRRERGPARGRADRVALAAFLAGSAVGGALAARTNAGLVEQLGRALWIEVGVILAAVVGPRPSMCVPVSPVPRSSRCLAVAMGVRNATVRKLAVPDLTTTVLTMTITGLAAESRVRGRTRQRIGAEDRRGRGDAAGGGRRRAVARDESGAAAARGGRARAIRDAGESSGRASSRVNARNAARLRRRALIVPLFRRGAIRGAK